MPQVAFHAPLKPPSHPVPSGDRKMARQLITLLERAGHEVAPVSELRSFLRDPDDSETRDGLRAHAQIERDRIARLWDLSGPPDLWMCYHPYYKSPDLIGPPLCQAFGVPWVSVEAALSARRSIGHWAEWQSYVQEAVGQATVNVALTERDAIGLSEIVPEAKIARLAPFIDVVPWTKWPPCPDPGHLISFAMMRPGDKLESFRCLAAALRRLKSNSWRLSVLGDGPARAEVAALFTGDLAERVSFAGEADEAAIAEALSTANACVWPGIGEAFGLAYLEAQAAGVPVVALRTAGVPEVVRDHQTGFLVEPDAGPSGLAAAIDRLLDDPGLARQLGATARDICLSHHSLKAAGTRLDSILNQWVWSSR
ncbi:MAG: glycosyltransferase family 4 protein [Pseudomonadota bacterium]